MFVTMAFLGATCSPLELLPRAASTGMLEFLFLRTRLYTAQSYYLSEQNETEKPSNEPPTDQEHRPGVRADQAHRSRLIARSILSIVSSKSSILKVVHTEYVTTVVICTVVRQQSAVCAELHCIEKLLAEATFVSKCTSIIRFSIQNFRFLMPSKK